jgi:alkanesulfonate monooxygenase SsuD/methylene tetrahydromethanopterin reductase-like flavin-dependent oxidoreductase (luciferase family)
VITAKMFSTIDHATGGRAELGIGASWAKHEHLAHGFPYPPLKERLARLEESLGVITALWTQENATFEGKYYQLRGVPSDPKPVQKPYPPIIIGGSNEGTLRIAARYANEWNVQGARLKAAEDIERMKAVCAESGRAYSELRVSHQMTMLITDKKDEAEAFVQRQIAGAANNPDFRESPLYPNVEAQVRDNVLAGDADTIKQGVRRWQDLGVTHLNFMTPRPFDRSILERFSREVMPAFA